MPGKQKVCRGGSLDGGPVFNHQDEIDCIRNGGDPAPISDGGVRSQITSDLTRSFVKLDKISKPRNPEVFSEYDTIERLTLMPLCILLKEDPKSDFLSLLNSFNTEHRDELMKVGKVDKAIFRSMYLLLLDFSSIAATGLETRLNKDQVQFPVSADIIGRAESTAKSIRAHTENDALLADLDRLVELGKVFEGVSIGSLIKQYN